MGQEPATTSRLAGRVRCLRTRPSMRRFARDHPCGGSPRTRAPWLVPFAEGQPSERRANPKLAPVAGRGAGEANRRPLAPGFAIARDRSRAALSFGRFPIRRADTTAARSPGFVITRNSKARDRSMFAFETSSRSRLVKAHGLVVVMKEGVAPGRLVLYSPTPTTGPARPDGATPPGEKLRAGAVARSNAAAESGEDHGGDDARGSALRTPLSSEGPRGSDRMPAPPSGTSSGYRHRGGARAGYCAGRTSRRGRRASNPRRG